MLIIILLLTFFLELGVGSLREVGSCPPLCCCDKVRSRTRRPATIDSFRLKCGGGDRKIDSLEDLTLLTPGIDVIYLDMSENRLSRLHQNSFADVPFLQKLNLSKNYIFSIEEDSFANLTNLKRLDLSGNRLKVITVPMFQGLQVLEKLKLSQNLITAVYEGAFDDLTMLKQLDLSSNPLRCNCELKWLLEWAQNTSVKLNPPPRCGSPPSLRDELLKKLDSDADLHCDLPDITESLLELNPTRSQVGFKGDALRLLCRTLSAGILVGENGEPQVLWFWEGKNASLIFKDVKFENRYLSRNGLVESTLVIQRLTENHTGKWDCHLLSQDRNETRTITLVVISEDTRYCSPTVTSNNKGVYVWPKTIVGFSSELPCEGEPLGMTPLRPPLARYYCNNFGSWDALNTTECPYISETTKLLEQFSKVNLSLTASALLESAIRLRNFTGDGKLLKDKMDVVYLSRTVEKYLNFQTLDKELGSALLDIVSMIMQLPKDRLYSAQTEDKSCTRLVKIIENVVRSMSAQVSKKKFAVEEFRVKRESFGGITCTSYSNIGRNSDRLFHCSTSNASFLTGTRVIDASIQVPASLFQSLDKHGVHVVSVQQLLFSMYENNNFFPRVLSRGEVNDARDVTSAVVGAKFVNIESFSLIEPVYIMLRMPSLDESVQPVWWDESVGKWNQEGCHLTQFLNELVVFQCRYLGYYGLLQDTEYYPGSDVRISGAKFRFSHPLVYLGTFLGTVCLLFSFLTYLFCFSAIQMSKKAKHALINTWLSTALLSVTFCFGIYQTENVRVCQVIGLTLHYFIISTLLWMAVTVSIVRKKIIKSDPLDTPGEEELPLEQPVQKPLMGLYLVGWGVALIVCGISGAVNIHDYAAYTHCFLAPNPAVSAVVLPATVLVVFLIYSFLRLCCVNRGVDTNGRLSEGTQATELDSTVGTTERVSFHSESAVTRSSEVEDTEHAPMAHLKAQAICLILYLTMCISAGIAVMSPFKGYIPYEQVVFNMLYASSCFALGAFILFFNCVARNDVRNAWQNANCSCKKRKRCCRTRSVSDTNQTLPVTLVPVVNNDSFLRPTSSNSANSSVRTKSGRSNTVKIVTDTNGMPKQGSTPTSESSVRILGVNIVELHRRRYRGDNRPTVSLDQSGTSGAEMFYNPYQITVARKFFRKQRQRTTSDFTTRRRTEGSVISSDCDSKSSVFFPSRIKSKKDDRFPINVQVQVENVNSDLNILCERGECATDSCSYSAVAGENLQSAHTMPLERFVIGAERSSSSMFVPAQTDDSVIVSVGELSDVESDTEHLNRLIGISEPTHTGDVKKFRKRRTDLSRGNSCNSNDYCSRGYSDSETEKCETASCGEGNKRTPFDNNNKLSNNSLCSNVLKSTSSLGRYPSRSSRPRRHSQRSVAEKTHSRSSSHILDAPPLSCDSSNVTKCESPTKDADIAGDTVSVTKKETSV